MGKHVRPFGAWPSTVSARIVAGQSLRFGLLQSNGEAAFWSETRPDEKGRVTIMRAAAGGSPRELLPASFSARSRVHEYGGGEFLVAGDDIYFVNDADQDIYLLQPPAAPRRLTDETALRFADMDYDARRRRLVAVGERHEGDGHHPENLLVAVDLEGPPGANVESLAEGHDFYAAPRTSPDGRRIAWLAWDLPHMPWEAAALHVAEIDAAGHPARPRVIAGGDGSAVFQPEWAPDGRLCFVWDQTGWGNLYAWDGAAVERLFACDGELGRPLWAFGMRSYACLDDGRVAVALIEDGETRLRVADLPAGELISLDAGLRRIDGLVAAGAGLAAIGVSDTAPPSVVHVRVRDGSVETLRISASTSLAPEAVSVGRTLRIAGDDGDAIHALYYPPTSADFEGPPGQLPPAILTVHGGPTGSADRGFKLKTQFWTSRGFAVCDVDYAGSWGYGRAYRERLNGGWGVRDVADVAAAARHLGEAGLADPARLVVSGGSAGGYTVLLALADSDLFVAGACYYGVSDLAQLQLVTHKFEAGYLYGLTGTTAETADAVFAARSPANRADRIATPVILFQGLQDKVVPPQQSERMAATLRRRRVPVAYLTFAEEAHGFRQAEALERALESEYAFYACVLGLPVTEALPEVAISDWPA